MIKKLGPYRIEKIVGRGGMGTVYAGIHEETGQLAALKALSATFVDDTNFRERFVAEIETLRKLNHPNIVRLYGEGSQDGYLFYAMQFVPGRSLQQMLQSGHRFEWREVIRIGIEICAALQHAHDRGVIHRDLKPANLLQHRDGPIMLTDFGIAKLFGGTQLTAAGSVVGTADYMPPEQAAGRQVTHRSDLYSLGSVMFTLLARRPPFAGNSLPQVVHSVRYDEVPSVCTFAPHVPSALADVISQLLQKQPADRIPTARAVAHRLTGVLRSFPPSTPDEESDNDQADPGPVVDDVATRASHPERGSATEISPTAIDDESAGGNEYSWNSATVVTSTRSDFEVDDRLAARDTIAENAHDDRFVSVESETLHEAGELREAEPQQPSHSGTVWLALALAGSLAAITWGVWPPSADTLYNRIVRISTTTEPSDATRQIDEFARRFPNDPRWPEIKALKMDIASSHLQSRLALRSGLSGGSALEVYEHRFLEAMRLVPNNPVAARAHFREFVEVYRTQARDLPELNELLDAARHQLRRLEQRIP